MKDTIFTITENVNIAKNVYRMRLAGDVSDIKNPGEFINIRLDGFYLRWPISVYDLGEEENTAFYVVGNSRDIFGGEWEEAMTEDNQMTLNDDGTYTKVYEGIGPIDGVVTLKVTNGERWIGSPFGGSVKVEVFDNADMTVRYDPSATDSPQVTVSGDGVNMHGFNPWAVDVMRVVGSAQGGFLNDLTWAVDADANNMTEISYGVYQITFEDIEANDGYQFIFAANGSRDDTFGCSSDALVGRANFAAYDGNTICFDVPEDNSTVTITLDMSQFDLAQEKYGASFTIKVVGPDGTEYISDFDTDVPPTEAPGPYPEGRDHIIASADDWNALAAYVADGGDTYGRTFILSEDITITTAIGTRQNPFKGFFEGGGHTLTLNLGSADRYWCPFCYISGATINNLTIDGEVTGAYTLGDVDGDGEVTILDATAIQRQLASLDVAAFNEKAADVDGDGEVTILDATAIQRSLAGLS